MQHENAKEINANREADPHWARLLFMILYYFLGSAAFCAAGLLGLVLLIMNWTRNKRHEGLESFAALLARYACDCLRYIVFASDAKPFPLGSLPRE